MTTVTAIMFYCLRKCSFGTLQYRRRRFRRIGRAHAQSGRALALPPSQAPLHMLKPFALLTVSALVALAACSDAAPKQPLGAEAAAAAAGTGLPPAAKEALDAGNAAYRAKQFALAIDKYREAAVAAPSHAAPWFGVYMAANELKNTALADSAMARVKALSADSDALGAHANAMAGPSSPAGPLPPGHPTTVPQLPPGHPAPTKRP